MRAVRVTAHGLLRSDVLVRYDKEVTRSEYIQSKDIQVIGRVEFLRPVAIANLEVIGVVLFVGGTLYLYAEQDAIVVQNEVIGKKITDGHAHTKASAKCLGRE